MPLGTTALTVEDLRQADLVSVLANSPQQVCEHFCDSFSAKVKEAHEAGNARVEEVYYLLGAASSFMFRLDSKDEPFGPIQTWPDGRRTVIPADFQDVHLVTLKSWVPEINDPELLARLADILWLRQRDFRMAQAAVNAYLDSAARLDSQETWAFAVNRIERALQVAASLGKKAEYFAKVIAYIRSILDKNGVEDFAWLPARLMALLQEHESGDPEKYAALSETAAKLHEANSNWPVAREYWELQARWYANMKEADKRREARLRAAETYVSESSEAIRRPTPSYLAATHSLQQAIEAFRSIDGTRERTEELHKTLLEYEKNVISEMKTASVSVDVAEQVKRARERVKGKSIQCSLEELAIIIRPPSVSDLREETKELIQQSPLMHLFHASIVNDEGKVISQQPNAFSNAPDEVEATVRAEMFAHANRHRLITAYAIIEPARQQINLDHQIRLHDLLNLLSNSPFVPAGREQIFARGIHAGFAGDFLISAHLLVPQIENSIRQVLNSLGEITSNLTSEGVQDEFNLNKLLELPKAKEVFGEDLLFDLQGFLVERNGSNLRNRLSHGLMAQEEFLSSEAVYLWWMTLHLCLVPLILGCAGENAAEEPRREAAISKIEDTPTNEAEPPNVGSS